MRYKMMVAIVVMAMVVGLVGCGTIRETAQTIEQDPAHAPENKAYYAQRLLETVVVKLSNTVLDTTTPREIADGIKQVLPATVLVSDALVTARNDYILLKAEIAAIEAEGGDPGVQRLEKLQAYLNAMDRARKAADDQRGTLSVKFGNHVSINWNAIHDEIGLEILRSVAV
jgi:hypothetical protein